MLVCWGLRPVGLLGYPCRRRNSIRPTGRHHRWRMCHRGTCIGTCAVIRARGPVWGAYAVAPRGFAAQGFSAQGFALGYGPPGLQPGRVRPIRAHGPVWGAYAIRPYRGTCIRVPSGTRPNSPASADARPYRGTCIRVFGQLPCPGRGCPQTPGLSYVLIGISVRLHLAFASGFLSVCEGKGLYVRRACQYVILRISSRPCAWPECSFYRCPICCLSAPYTAHGVSEIREP